MDKLRTMILRKTIHDAQHLKRYSVALPNALSQLFNQPKSRFKFLVKNQTVSYLFILLNILNF